MAQILQLYQLQSLDSEITQINRQLADIAAKLGESEELQQARSETEAAQTMVRGAQTRTQDLDLELKSLTGKITNQEKLLYSGKVLNAKEAANLQEEVANYLKGHFLHSLALRRYSSQQPSLSFIVHP